MTRITVKSREGNIRYVRYEMQKKEFVKSKFDLVGKELKPEPLYKGMKVVESGNKVSVWYNFK